MTRPSFDLSRKPCVPVFGNGTAEMVSLRDALARAHELQEVQHELPTVEFGLYRLLIALVGDIFFVEPGEPLNTLRLSRLLALGRFNEPRIDAYFEKYTDRFDLFHEERPFLQVGSMQGEEKPVANLLHPLPSGTNITHFHHAHENDFVVCAEAALGLLAAAGPFAVSMKAGKNAQYPSSLNRAPPIYVLIRGKNLFETLCLNFYAMPLVLARVENDAPAWRWQPERKVGGERQNVGYLESLTWMPRCVQLEPDSGGVCTLTAQESEILLVSFIFRHP